MFKPGDYVRVEFDGRVLVSYAKLSLVQYRINQEDVDVWVPTSSLIQDVHYDKMKKGGQ